MPESILYVPQPRVILKAPLPKSLLWAKQLESHLKCAHSSTQSVEMFKPFQRFISTRSDVPSKQVPKLVIGNIGVLSNNVCWRDDLVHHRVELVFKIDDRSSNLTYYPLMTSRVPINQLMGNALVRRPQTS